MPTIHQIGKRFIFVCHYCDILVTMVSYKIKAIYWDSVAPKTHLLKKRNPRKTTTSIQHNSDNKWHQTHLKQKNQKPGKMLGRKKTDKNQPWLSDLLSTSWKSLKESEKSNVRAFTVSIGDPVKWDSNPGTLGIDFWCRDKRRITTTHINWWTQCQCNTISSSSVVMTKSNQIKSKKSNELWAIYDIEQQQQIIDDVLSSTNHHFYKTHDNHNIVYFIH